MRCHYNSVVFPFFVCCDICTFLQLSTEVQCIIGKLGFLDELMSTVSVIELR